MKVILNEKRCKRCGICMAFCPKNVFEQTEFGQIMPTRSEDCVGCRMCEMRCPDFAIAVKEA